MPNRRRPARPPKAKTREAPWLSLAFLGFAWLFRRTNLGFPPNQCWLWLAFLGFRAAGASARRSVLAPDSPQTLAFPNIAPGGRSEDATHPGARPRVGDRDRHFQTAARKHSPPAQPKSGQYGD
jgi:hypothetical protein